MKYSILMFNFGGYEVVREPEEIDPEAEYICVTDTPELYKDSKWTVIVDSKLERFTAPFDKCLYVRYHAFEYVNTEICILIDGSMQIHKSLAPIIDMFTKEYDAAYCLNIWCYRFLEDYKVWVKKRNYPKQQAIKLIQYFINHKKWDLEYNGYIEIGFRIIRKTQDQKELDEHVYYLLKEFGIDGNYERLDQVFYSYVLQKFHNQNVLPFYRQILSSKYITYCLHGTRRPDVFKILTNKAWLYNKEYTCIDV